MTLPRAALPSPLPPRGLSRVEAAAYIGVSPSLFDQMEKDRRMPAPKRNNARTVWDRLGLDAAFAALPDDGPSQAPAANDPWGGHLALFRDAFKVDAAEAR